MRQLSNPPDTFRQLVELQNGAGCRHRVHHLVSGSSGVHRRFLQPATTTVAPKGWVSTCSMWLTAIRPLATVQ